MNLSDYERAGNTELSGGKRVLYKEIFTIRKMSASHQNQPEQFEAPLRFLLVEEMWLIYTFFRYFD